MVIILWNGLIITAWPFRTSPISFVLFNSLDVNAKLILIFVILLKLFKLCDAGNDSQRHLIRPEFGHVTVSTNPYQTAATLVITVCILEQ